MRFLLAILTLASATAWAAPSVPFIAGAQLESGVGLMPDGKAGAGIVRATPYLGAWLQGMGYVKLGAAIWKTSITDTSDALHETQQRDLSIQLGASFLGPDKPYFITSYTKARQLSENGDADWTEWGLGLGSYFPLGSGFGALTLEAEYRWIGKHHDPMLNLDVEGTRIQMNIGFVVYFL